MGRPIPDAASVAKKWAERTSGASQEWVDRSKQSTWKNEAVAGEANFKTAMTTVISKELRKKGIEKSSDQVWQVGIEGSQTIFADQVTKAQDTMNTAIAKVLNDEKAIVAQLAARGPKGSAGNFERSRKVGEFLHNEAVKRQGS